MDAAELGGVLVVGVAPAGARARSLRGERWRCRAEPDERGVGVVEAEKQQGWRRYVLGRGRVRVLLCVCCLLRA